MQDTERGELGRWLVAQVEGWHADATLDTTLPTRYVICVGLAILERMRTEFPLPETSYKTEVGEVRTSGALIKKILARYGIFEQFAKAGGRTTGASALVALPLVERLNAADKMKEASPRHRTEAIDAAQRWLSVQAARILAETRHSVRLPEESTPEAVVSTLITTPRGAGSQRVVARLLMEALLLETWGRPTGFLNQGLAQGSTDHLFAVVYNDWIVAIDIEPAERVVLEMADLSSRGYRVRHVVAGQYVDQVIHYYEVEDNRQWLSIHPLETTIGFVVDQWANTENGTIPAAFRRLMVRYEQLVAQRSVSLPVRFDLSFFDPTRRLPAIWRE